MKSMTLGFFSIKFFLGIIIVADACCANGNSQIVSIQGWYGQNCTGVIVSSFDVLTTVNCTRGPVERLLIRSGSNFRQFGGTVHNATNVTKHERYGVSYIPVNDIAIIRVKQAFNNTTPIRLLHHPLMPNTTANAVKWGLMGFQEELRNSTVSIVNKTRCNFDYHGDLREGQICTASNYTLQGPCLDNAGVPLIVNGSLAGIFSFSQGCLSNKPAVYTEIAYYYDWINRHISHNTTGHKPNFNPFGHGMIPSVINPMQHSNDSNSHSQNNNKFSNIVNKFPSNLMNKPDSKNGTSKRNSASSVVSNYIIFYTIVQLIFVLVISN